MPGLLLLLLQFVRNASSLPLHTPLKCSWYSGVKDKSTENKWAEVITLLHMWPWITACYMTWGYHYPTPSSTTSQVRQQQSERQRLHQSLSQQQQHSRHRLHVIIITKSSKQFKTAPNRLIGGGLMNLFSRSYFIYRPVWLHSIYILILNV